jgi:hypothetical protein
MTHTWKGTKEQLDYVSYLLRLWRENGEKTIWRASLESSHTGERKGFATGGRPSRVRTPASARALPAWTIYLTSCGDKLVRCQMQGEKGEEVMT